MINYNLADLLARINVAYRAHLKSIKVLKTKLNIQFLYLLYKIGLLKSFYISTNGNTVLVCLKYKKSGQPLMHSLDLVSKPSKRVYWTLTMLSKNYRKHAVSSFYIISTSKGLITSNEALLCKNISGEILCKIKI